MKRSFPYTNFHDLNLDWIISKMKEWGGLIEQKIIEINKAVLTVNTAIARATAAEASATAAQEAAKASETAAAASAKAAQEAAEASGGYDIEDEETSTNFKYRGKYVYVKRLYLGYHMDVDTDIFYIPYNNIDGFVKIEILRKEVYSTFKGLVPVNIAPSGSDAKGLIVNVDAGVTEGYYYAILYYTKL